MGKKLAIKGHPTRGKEVIELLEMMGGVNWMGSLGNTVNRIYYISESKSISFDDISLKLIDEYEIFTLEEFWEKYPIMIGDEVTDLKTDKIAEVYKMHWSENNSCIYYDIKYPNNCGCQRRLMDLKSTNDVDDVHSISECKTIGQGTYAIKIADGYKFDSIDENGNIIVKSIKPKYPKTYEECCEVLGIGSYFEPEIRNATTEECHIFMKLMRLKRCRNAYWKIAGEEMGLGKPWKPNWDDENEYKYSLFRLRKIIYKDATSIIPTLLIFPTIELRDAFYENFKDLIEQCKELL